MGLFLVALHFGGENIIALKFFKYAILTAFLVTGLNTYKKYLYKDTIFKNGMLFGAYISFLSAITLAAISTATFILLPDFAFEKFGLKSDSLGYFLSVTGTIFFEIIVLGTIITFIVLQYLKATFKPNKGLQ